MKKILNILLLAIVSIGIFIGAISVVRHIDGEKADYMEYFGIGYSDRISFIVEGYQLHWDGFSPENLQLSPVYLYESPYSGFVQHDIDGDGIEELIMGDQFEDGSYQIYDIYTYDKSTGETIRLFCGGERDWCLIRENGEIVENGSNSAFDSFTKTYVLEKYRLRSIKQGKTETGNDSLLKLTFDRFVNYSQPEQTQQTGQPE